LLWSKGPNYLATSSSRSVYPHFFGEEGGSFAPSREVASPLGPSHCVVVYCPPGYNENTLKRYPTLYMHDAQNLFFPSQAYTGKTFAVAETLSVLDSMNLIDKVLVVGVYPNDRMEEYTRRGYVPYGDFLATTLKPMIDDSFRTLAGPETTAVMGASLGGVVSMHVALAHRDRFGMCGCLSSTFGYDDDLFERVATTPLDGTRIYLDSGWPQDNFEVTRAMRDALRRRGRRFGRDYLYLAFPGHLHDERYWAMRSHLPYQFFFGGPREDGAG
jgi:predicted alpha/beta superfamily hydrolase